jgi:hypothetical protein
MTMLGGLVMLLADGVGGVIIWSLLIIGLVIGGFVAVTWLRRWVSSADDAPAGGFSLGELRRLHQEGQMSDEEYEKAKAMIVEVAKAAAAKQAERLAAGKNPPRRTPPPGMTR